MTKGEKAARKEMGASTLKRVRRSQGKGEQRRQETKERCDERVRYEEKKGERR